MSVQNNNINNNGHIQATPIDEVKKDKLPSIPELLKLLMLEGTERLRVKKLEDLKKVAASQQEVGFLNNLKSAFMRGANDDGSYTTGDQLKSLLLKASNPGSESLMHQLGALGLFDADAQNLQGVFANIKSLDDTDRSQELLAKLDSLGIKENQQPTQAQLDSLVQVASEPENADLFKYLTNNQILSPKKTFTKVEREDLIDRIRQLVDEKNQLNEIANHEISQLQSKINELQAHVVDLWKIYKRAIDAIIGNMRPR